MINRAAVALSMVLAVSIPAWAQEHEPNPTSTSVKRDAAAENRTGNGHEVFDPTRNVLDLVRAEKERQDDLRRLVEELLKAELKSVNTQSEIRSIQDRELLKAATERLDNEAKLRAEFDKEIRVTEKARVDAIRQVDKAAVDQASSAATQTAANLAKTVTESAGVISAQGSASADALRNLVATTAAETNRNIQQQFTTIGARVSALEQGSAQGVGERKYSDPAVATLVEEVRKISRAQNESAGVSSGSSTTWALFIAVGTMLIGGIIAFVTLSRRVTKNGHNGVPQGG